MCWMSGGIESDFDSNQVARKQTPKALARSREHCKRDVVRATLRLNSLRIGAIG